MDKRDIKVLLLYFDRLSFLFFSRGLLLILQDFIRSPGFIRKNLANHKLMSSWSPYIINNLRRLCIIFRIRFKVMFLNSLKFITKLPDINACQLMSLQLTILTYYFRQIILNKIRWKLSLLYLIDKWDLRGSFFLILCHRNLHDTIVTFRSVACCLFIDSWKLINLYSLSGLELYS